MNDLEESSFNSSHVQNWNLNNPPKDLAAAILGSSVVSDELKSFLKAQIQQLPAAALAYLGDAVYELYVRTHFILPPKRSQIYHQHVVAQVRAERQAHHLLQLQPLLTDYEQGFLKRGRNAAAGKPKRVDAETYQQASSLETLVGYLYLTDPQRLAWLMQQLDLDANAAMMDCEAD